MRWFISPDNPRNKRFDAAIGRVHWGRWIALWVAWVVGVGICPSIMLDSDSTYARVLVYVCNAGCGAIAMAALISKRQQKLNRRRANNECLACGYSLAGLTPPGQCPECGAKRIAALSRKPSP